MSLVKSLTSWCALLLLIFLRISSFLLHCSPVQFSFPFLRHFLMLLFTSLSFSDPPGPNHLFFFQFSAFVHRSRTSAVAQGVFFWRFRQVWHWLFQLLLCWRWWSLNPCLYLHYPWWWKVQTSRRSQLERFPTHWDLSAFRGQTWVLCFGLLILFRWRWKVIISKS